MMKLKINNACRYFYFKLQDGNKKDVQGIRFDLHSKESLGCQMYGRFMEIGLGVNNTSPDLFWLSSRLSYNKFTIDSLATETV